MLNFPFLTDCDYQQDLTTLISEKTDSVSQLTFLNHFIQLDKSSLLLFQHGYKKIAIIFARLAQQMKEITFVNQMGVLGWFF